MHNAPSVTRRNQKYETRSPGVVPDFDRLHRDFDMEMTRVRSNMRRNITVPVEFKLNGVTPEDQHERDHKVRHLGQDPVWERCPFVRIRVLCAGEVMLMSFGRG